MKFLKRHKFIVFLVVCFILGFLMAPLFHSGYIGRLGFSFKRIKWYFHILLFLLAFILSLSLHELTHFITFSLLGYENEMLIILFFIFYKENNKWKVKIDFKLLILLGGLSYPNLGEINNDSDYNKAKNAMLKSLLSAPLFTLISGSLLFLVSSIFFYKTSSLFVFAIYFGLFSLLYTYVSTKETNDIKGDFKAFKRVKDDEAFSLLVLSQYAEPSEYIYNMIVNKQTLNKSTLSLKDNAFLSYIIEYELSKFKINFEVYDIVYKYTNINRFKRLINSYEGFQIGQSLLIYFNKCNLTHNVEELLDVYSKELLNSKLKDAQKEYLLKQTLHILKIENHDEFLNNKNNINNNNLSFITKHIPSVVVSEFKRNKGFKPFELKCKIK